MRWSITSSNKMSTTSLLSDVDDEKDFNFSRIKSKNNKLLLDDSKDDETNSCLSISLNDGTQNRPTKDKNDDDKDGEMVRIIKKKDKKKKKTSKKMRERQRSKEAVEKASKAADEASKATRKMTDTLTWWSNKNKNSNKNGSATIVSPASVKGSLLSSPFIQGSRRRLRALKKRSNSSKKSKNGNKKRDNDDRKNRCDDPSHSTGSCLPLLPTEETPSITFDVLNDVNLAINEIEEIKSSFDKKSSTLDVPTTAKMRKSKKKDSGDKDHQHHQQQEREQKEKKKEKLNTKQGEVGGLLRYHQYQSQKEQQEQRRRQRRESSESPRRRTPTIISKKTQPPLMPTIDQLQQQHQHQLPGRKMSMDNSVISKKNSDTNSLSSPTPSVQHLQQQRHKKHHTRRKFNTNDNHANDNSGVALTKTNSARSSKRSEYVKLANPDKSSNNKHSDEQQKKYLHRRKFSMDDKNSTTKYKNNESKATDVRKGRSKKTDYVELSEHDDSCNTNLVELNNQLQEKLSSYSNIDSPKSKNNSSNDNNDNKHNNNTPGGLSPRTNSDDNKIRNLYFNTNDNRNVSRGRSRRERSSRSLSHGISHRQENTSSRSISRGRRHTDSRSISRGKTRNGSRSISRGRENNENSRSISRGRENNENSRSISRGRENNENNDSRRSIYRGRRHNEGNDSRRSVSRGGNNVEDHDKRRSISRGKRSDRDNRRKTSSSASLLHMAKETNNDGREYAAGSSSASIATSKGGSKSILDNATRNVTNNDKNGDTQQSFKTEGTNTKRTKGRHGESRKKQPICLSIEESSEARDLKSITLNNNRNEKRASNNITVTRRGSTGNKTSTSFSPSTPSIRSRRGSTGNYSVCSRSTANSASVNSLARIKLRTAPARMIASPETNDNNNNSRRKLRRHSTSNTTVTSERKKDHSNNDRRR